MKKFLFLLLCLVSTFSLFSQKQIDDANAEVRNVGSFHGIKSSSGITVYLVQGDEEKVAVSANEVSYRNKIRTVVEKGILKIYYDNDDWKLWQAVNGRKLRAYVSVKNIDLIEASSGSDIKIEGSIKSSDIKIESSSGASIKGRVEVSSMNAELSSGSTIILSGLVSNKVTLDGSSGSMFKCFDLLTDNCEVDISSGAGVQITVNKDLKVDASSGGFVQYKGSASISDVHTSSGGSVTRK